MAARLDNKDAAAARRITSSNQHTNLTARRVFRIYQEQKASSSFIIITVALSSKIYA
jgi:hypothetical protein